MTRSRKKTELALTCTLTGFVLVIGSLAATVHGQDQDSGFVTPLFGWDSTEKYDYSFAVPFYSHHCWSEPDEELTLIYPLLTALYRGEVSESAQVDGTLCLPLLALIGKMDDGNHGTSGYFSPLLAAGAYRWRCDDNEVDASGLSLLPWLPLIEDFANLHLYSSSRAAGQGGAYDYWDMLALPGLDFSLFESRNAGIEGEFRFCSIWNFSLYRTSLDLPGCGFSPGMDELSTHRTAQHLLYQENGTAEERIAGLSKRLNQHLDEARSGSPIERTGLLDPMFVYESQGEELFAMGAEPLFFIDDEEGFSLPFLLTTFADDGVRFGFPAVKHLFPLFHGNRDNTRFDFLAQLGTYYSFDQYTALDVKLLFNWQQHAERGTVWGCLPYFFGDFPGRNLNEQARFVQLPTHAFSWWDLDDEQGCELLAPFLFSWKKTKKKSRTRFLALFGISSDEETAFEFDFCGLPLISIDSE